MSTFWTCQRVRKGVKCATRNPGRKKLCGQCLAPKPARRRAKHLVALETPYEAYLELCGGVARCGVCGRSPGSRRLDRDHDHRTGKPRGLLCARCNRALPGWISPEWLRSAADYLEAAAA